MGKSLVSCFFETQCSIVQRQYLEGGWLSLKRHTLVVFAGTFNQICFSTMDMSLLWIMMLFQAYFIAFFFEVTADVFFPSAI